MNTSLRIAVAGGTGMVGAHVVRIVRERGHEPVVLARSSGVDLVAGTGLSAALEGVDAVIDVASTGTNAAKESIAFFEATTSNLLAAERERGVGHHVALSIIGVPEAPHGYYAGKARQEELVTASGSGWSLLRASQFHEFAVQMTRRMHVGPVVVSPVMRTQPIAATEVAEALVEIAEGAPRGDAGELAGPRIESMPDMVRRYLRATGRSTPVLAVPLPGAFGRALRDGTILPKPGARLGSRTFDAWLAAQAGVAS
jgi:uncharacterized protein YbjT (DUF2867 family)